MYNEFYGFNEKPFSLTPDPHFLYLSSVHKKALAYLLYGLEDRKGFIVVTGEVGAGKTTIVRTLMQRLPQDTVISRIVNTTVNSQQLLKMIVRDFGITITSEAKEDILEELNEFLLQQYSEGHNAVLIIDEAQNLASSTLEEIRLLSNLETEKDKLIQILLVGQPELRKTLDLPELRQLKQRVTVNYHISSLGTEEVHEYIKHRIKVAGAKKADIFSPEAMQKIAVISKGIPRVINIICDAALVVGYVETAHQISLALLNEVLEELKVDLSIDKMIYYTSEEDEQPARKKTHQKEEAKDTADTKKLLKRKMEEIDNIMTKLDKMEKDLEKRAKRIKKKEQELDI